ncbi:DNA starvation/stationary phase protection protein [Kitasatospora sp. NPDC005856]|uniref:Dps family protein n=1 Tax=Kitasatospora sp. NPDC005856 TaxID=3154566 RepID=UPI0034053CF2
MTSRLRPHLHGPVLQEFGTVMQLPIALSPEVRQYSCRRLDRALADTQFLYLLYKKYQWGMRGPISYQLHLLFDKHAEEQLELVDALAERVQSLGGVAVGDLRHAAQITGVPRPPDGIEGVRSMLSRLLDAHKTILADVRDAAARTAELGDDGTQDLLVSQSIRTGETQVWFLAEYLVVAPETGE